MPLASNMRKSIKSELEIIKKILNLSVEEWLFF